MSAAIPLISSHGMKSPSDPYAEEYEFDRYGHAKGSPSSLLARIGSNKRLYLLAALLVLLGAGLDALRTHAPAALAGRAAGYAVQQQFDTNKLAVLLEPRNEPVLIPVLQNFFANLPPAWPVQMHTSSATAEYLRLSPKIQPHLASGKFKIVILPNDGKDVHSGETLSEYLAKDSSFWDLLAPAEHLLFFQTDSVLCSKSEFSVDDFLGLNDTRTDGKGYAWVGAVWAGNHWPYHPWAGNGGLSIRRRSIMLEITNNDDWPGQSEDGYFAQRIDAHYPDYVLFPTQYTAMRFSFENKPGDGPDEDWVWQPHGIHLGGGWWPCAWNLWQQVRRLQDWCPEMNAILSNDCHPHKDQGTFPPWQTPPN